jgi:hypothetical protein
VRPALRDRDCLVFECVCASGGSIGVRRDTREAITESGYFITLLSELFEDRTRQDVEVARLDQIILASLVELYEVAA